MQEGTVQQILKYLRGKKKHTEINFSVFVDFVLDEIRSGSR